MTPTHAAVWRAATARGHRPSDLHGADLGWVEKNCYVDLWIELLHARGLEPRACLAFLPAIDFEGDQWTFFKPPLADLRTLYGIEVQELTLWRPLLDHALEHLADGKWLAVEVDAYWLPDAGTDYRSAHSKTTVVFNEIDTAARRLGYFHNAGYFELTAEDFDGLFAAASAPRLPPYAELIRLDRVVVQSDDALRRASGRLLDEHLAWRPQRNPVLRFAERFETDLSWLQQTGLETYHRWAFAGLRQLGAGFELAAHHLRWLQAGTDAVATAATAAHFERLSAQAKTLMLKAARSVNSGRPPAVGNLFDDMADAWDRGMAGLLERSSRQGALAA